VQDFQDLRKIVNVLSSELHGVVPKWAVPLMLEAGNIPGLYEP